MRKVKRALHETAHIIHAMQILSEREPKKSERKSARRYGLRDRLKMKNRFHLADRYDEFDAGICS